IDATITVTVSVTDVNEAPGKPDAPTFGAATASSLVVNWTAPSNSGPEISDYDVQYRKGTSGEWSAHAHSGTVTTATISGLDADSAYQVQVQATNDEGTGEWSESGSGSTAAANAAPSFTSSAAVSVAENQTTVVTVQASDPDTQDSITGYAISGGADRAKFSIVEATGALTFADAPDYESPTDANTDNVYNVTVEATSGTGDREMKATQDIAVTVTDVPAAKPTSAVEDNAETFTVSGEATGPVTLTVPARASSVAPAGMTVTLPAAAANRLAGSSDKVTVKTVTQAGGQSTPPAGFKLGGTTVDISGITLQSGETATVCLPRLSSSKAESIHRWDTTEKAWVKLTAVSPPTKTVGVVTLVCAVTDKFSVFATTQAAEPIDYSRQVGHPVPADSSLIPTDGEGNPLFTAGQSFRLLFVTSSTNHAATSPDIATYNAAVQGKANANANLRPFKGEFRALISTATVHARDNTGTTGTGVPIYWVGGDKAADDYADFYDGSWDSRAGRTEAGTAIARGIFPAVATAWTGSHANGTLAGEAHAGSGSKVNVGNLSTTGSTNPINAWSSSGSSRTRLYGLSPVLTVGADSAAPTVTGAEITSDPGDDGAYKIGDSVVATV
ncbi:MAG: fibronectin type III domain-containing protein, partial [Spirochaetaceae bacterium]|nr:fibronectin type III domain-containing protein [Spirochaetaceae bacterium]